MDSEVNEIPENEINEIRRRGRNLIVLGGSEGITEERVNQGETERRGLGIVGDNGQGETVERTQQEGEGGRER